MIFVILVVKEVLVGVKVHVDVALTNEDGEVSTGHIIADVENGEYKINTFNNHVNKYVDLSLPENVLAIEQAISYEYAVESAKVQQRIDEQLAKEQAEQVAQDESSMKLKNLEDRVLLLEGKLKDVK